MALNCSWTPACARRLGIFLLRSRAHQPSSIFWWFQQTPLCRDVRAIFLRPALDQSRCNDREVTTEHATLVTQEACDYQGVHAEGLPDLRHQTRESGSSDAASDVRSEQVGALDVDPAEFFIWHSHKHPDVSIAWGLAPLCQKKWHH